MKITDLLRGVSRASGVVVGFLPIAMSFGAIAIQAGLSSWETVAMSIGVYAGASQFAAIEALRQGLPWFSIVLTMWIINLRHIPMSLAAAQHIYRWFPFPYRWLLAHGLVDETFALQMGEPPQPLPYYLGMNLCCWIAWIAGTWLGCQVGVILPERWLQFALPALFLCLLMNNLRAYQNRSLPGCRSQGRDLGLVIGVGIVLVLTLQGLGAMGILLAIIGVAVVASWRLQSHISLPEDVS